LPFVKQIKSKFYINFSSLFIVDTLHHVSMPVSMLVNLFN